MPTEPLYVFFHIPRTGGTTVNGHLGKHLAFDEEFVHFGGTGDLWRKRHGAIPLDDRTPAEWQRVRVISGHRIRHDTHLRVPGKTPRNITIIRDPADRIVSTYHYRMASGGHAAQSFEDWYSTYQRDRAFRWLRNRLGVGSLDEVLEKLRGFWFVGATEHLNEDLPRLFRTIGVPETWQDLRVASDGEDAASSSHDIQPFGLVPEQEGKKLRRLVDLTDDLRRSLHEDNRRDLRLYRLALRRRDRTNWE